MREIKASKKDKIAYDPHMLDGIEFIDTKSAVSYIKSMIPSSEYDRNSPYVPIRKLVKFFDKDKGVLRHGRKGSADLIKYLYKQDAVRKPIISLTVKDSELLALVYEQKTYVGTELVDRVRWKLDEIQKDVQSLLHGLNESECEKLFEGKEAMDGSKDGRLVGLSELIINATQKADEMTRNVKLLDDILRKGKDPMEYSCVGATKSTRKVRIR